MTTCQHFPAIGGRAEPRNPAIELFRILAMFGICMIHVSGQGPYRSVWPTNLCCAAVPAFIFISGYFGVRFSVSKLLRLYGLLIFYCFLIPIVGGWGESGYMSSVMDVWCAPRRFWFLHAYAMLMCVSPLVNLFFERHSESRRNLLVVVPYFAVIFFWGYLTNFRHLDMIVPSTAGIRGGGTFMTMLGIYLAGRTFKAYSIERFLTMSIALSTAIVSAILISVLGSYSSPYQNPLHFVLSASVFCLFKQVRLPIVLSKIVYWAAPSMFAIYLTHALWYLPGWQRGQYDTINMINTWLVAKGIPVLGAFILTSLCIFAVSLAVDSVRRLFARVLFRHANKYWQCIDKKYDSLIDQCHRILMSGIK